MIRIDDKLVEHLCKLARISVADWDRLKSDLQKIIDYFDILNEVDTTDVEPMYTPVEGTAYLRETQSPKTCDEVEEIVKNFPERQERFIKIPGIYG